MSVSGGELSFIDQLFAVSTTTSGDSTNVVSEKNESVEVEVEEKVEEVTTETKTMSEYERRRLENISRNNEAMRRFGIIPTEMEEAPLRVEETEVGETEDENEIEVVDETKAHESLLYRWPGRELDLQRIEDAIGTGHPGGFPSLPGFAVYGREANSACSLVTDTLSEFKLRYCYVDCSLVSTCRQLYYSILSQLDRKDRGQITGLTSSNPGNFVRETRKLASENADRALYIVLDRAQKLASLNMSALSLHLQDQVLGSNVCLICVSTVELRGHFSMLRAVTRLNDLAEKDLVTMLCRKRKRDDKDEEEEEESKITDEQYRIFVQTIYRSSYKFCRDIREISFLIDVLLPKLRLVCGKNKKTTPREVVKHVTEWLSRATHFMFTHDLDNFENRSASKMRIAQNFPVRQRIMLVAAFLSSWNPAGTDTQFRATSSVRATKRKRRSRASVRSSDWEKIRLKGPQTFTFYRLWDNYKAMLTNSDIVNSKLLTSDRSDDSDLNMLEMLEPTNANDFAMVNTLVECHLLQQTSSSVLNPRYRCIAPKEMVATCARFAGIKLEDHLLVE
eukprot:g5769.t1